MLRVREYFYSRNGKQELGATHALTEEHQMPPYSWSLWDLCPFHVCVFMFACERACGDGCSGSSSVASLPYNLRLGFLRKQSSRSVCFRDHLSPQNAGTASGLSHTLCAYMGSGDLSSIPSGPHTFMARALPTKSFPSPFEAF